MTSKNNSGLVVDIHRFSLYDGPGIRTVVFLKGCPLDCLWCHNPESKSYKPQLSFNQSKCTNCFECVKVCSNGAHFIDANGAHSVDFEKCRACGNCAEVCPSGALTIIGKPYTADEIVSLALKDKPYYDESGGGITLSGGEPMAQFEFTLDVLKKAKAAGLHTALETCGFTRVSRYLDVMPYVDLFLYDYKATNPIAHKEYTGADNNLILDNLRVLAESGAEIVLRCPLIPGFNDTDDHLKGIASLSLTYPNIKMIEIMPYHTIGLDKAKKIGAPQQLAGFPASTAEDKLLWLAKIKNYGCPESMLKAN